MGNRPKREKALKTLSPQPWTFSANSVSTNLYLFVESAYILQRSFAQK
jgi:hypothetical protein